MYKFYEFFAGGGMARAGLNNEWECKLANDFSDKKAASYIENWGDEELIIGDVGKIDSTLLNEVVDLSWASFPCQDLSLAGAGAGLDGQRSGAFWGFWKHIQYLNKRGMKPRTIVPENVYGMLTSHGGNDFLNLSLAIVDEGYIFGALLIDAVNFVPQSRPRVFILCVDETCVIPSLLSTPEPQGPWYPKRLVDAFKGLPAHVTDKWRWWNIPAPETAPVTLESVIDVLTSADGWDSTERTQSLLNIMSPLHLEKICEMKKLGHPVVGTIYKRTRGGVQRAEVRFDGVAGCLRTPSGGSSRQTIILVDGDTIRTRLIAPREAARLMGLPDTYVLPEKYNDAYHLIGDGVVVPVVGHINKNFLIPLLDAQPKN